MKKSLLFAVLFALLLPFGSAVADVKTSPWTTEVWALKRGTTSVGPTYATKALCQAAVTAAVNARGSSGNYFCVGTSGTRADYAVSCAAAPASSQTNACAVANTSPPWTQTRTVTATDAFNGCWTVGAWTPATMPATACQPPVQTGYTNTYVPIDSASVTAMNTAAGIGTATRNPTNGWSGPMLIPTTEVAPSSDIGAFRTGCQFVKFGFFDPIVSPGVDNSSHLHTFFGNMGIVPASTSATIANSGASTCRGGTINRSSYWVPSLIDMRTQKPVKPMFESNFYYKTGYAVPSASIVDLPQGLRMIAGDASCTQASCQTAGLFACVWSGGANGVGAGNTNFQSSIPTSCTVNGTSWLIVAVDFPQCWNGELDSPDHKSHMTNPVGVGANNTGHCPSSHPFALPQIAYQILYRYDNDPALLANIRLSSDKYPTTQPAGYSMHGDYIMGWGNDAQGNPVVPVWTQKCDREQKDCHSHLLGDGRAMVIP